MALMNKYFEKAKYYFPLFFQLCRFGIVGVLAAAVHLGIVVAIVQNFHIAPLIANVFAFAISFQCSYWGHRYWTFNALEVPHTLALPKLLFIQIANFAANESLFYIFLALGFSYPIAMLIVLAILPIFTFISSKLWVFR